MLGLLPQLRGEPVAGPLSEAGNGLKAATERKAICDSEYEIQLVMRKAHLAGGKMRRLRHFIGVVNIESYWAALLICP